MVKLLENVVFKLRAIILLGLLVFTCITGFYALQLRMTAGFDKQLPVGHEYIQTFTEYREQLFGSNRIIVVLEPKEGDVWSKEFFKVYKNLTDDIFFLPGSQLWRFPHRAFLRTPLRAFERYIMACILCLRLGTWLA